jgi:putative membrane protein
MFALLAETVSETSVPFLSETFWPGIVLTAAFGLLGIALLLLGYWLFDLITPRLDFQKELGEKNMAVGLVIAALLLGIAYIVGVSIK